MQAFRENGMHIMSFCDNHISETFYFDLCRVLSVHPAIDVLRFALTDSFDEFAAQAHNASQTTARTLDSSDSRQQQQLHQQQQHSLQQRRRSTSASLQSRLSLAAAAERTSVPVTGSRSSIARAFLIFWCSLYFSANLMFSVWIFRSRFIRSQFAQCIDANGRGSNRPAHCAFCCAYVT